MKTGDARPFLRGFYLHACWKFNYPFAVRSWAQVDFEGMFALLRQLGFNLIVFWPPFESIPAPLGEGERTQLLFYRDLVARARLIGLETWVVQTANITVRPEIAQVPIPERHLYPYRVDVHLDDPHARQAYLAHRKEMQRVLNNADAYVTIDGDPGSYPGAKPEALVDVFLADRSAIDEFGTHPQEQKIIPWIWYGWGSVWKDHKPWSEPIEAYTRPVLEEIKARMRGPWELLPGRSSWDHAGTGRVNFALAEEAGLIPQSILFTYELIEFEPIPPGIRIQFDDIRRVFRQEKDLMTRARGIVGNAQQPLMALPNLFFFSKAADDMSYLSRSDDQVLADLALFLGGDPALLVPAWDCLRRGLIELSPDLPEKLAASKLSSAAAAHLPGGPAGYLKILAAFVKLRLALLLECQETPALHPAETISRCLIHAYDWWKLTGYIFSGESGAGFRLRHVQQGSLQPDYLDPLIKWISSLTTEARPEIDQAVQLFAEKSGAGDLDSPGLVQELAAYLPPPKSPV